MTLTEKTTKAKQILKKYNRKLEPSWKGIKNVWHAWHNPFMIYLMTWEQYIDRVIEIEENKPEKEKPIRFKFFKPVKGIFKKSKADADWQKAYADWQKADAVWQKAYADWQKAYADWKKAYADWKKAYADLQKAYADWQKADADLQKADADWNKAYADWRKADADSIKKLHLKECPDCPWDYEKNELMFN